MKAPTPIMAAVHPMGWVFSLVILFSAAMNLDAREVRNVILFIGDGMGSEHIRAAELGSGSNFQFRSFPSVASFATRSADSRITDSAAASTAFATGRKVNNGVISMALPGTGAALQTVLEYFKSKGKRTGLITTSFLTDATPAAFAAHEISRLNRDPIASDYLTTSRPDLLLGGGGEGLTAARAAAAGYQVVSNRLQLASLSSSTPGPICGIFGTQALPYEYDGLGDFPHLTEMLASALKILEDAPAGFFLMVEGGLIDRASHLNDLERCLPEVVELSRAVDHARAWAQGRSDTLILVVADHETGGLKIVAASGNGAWPTVTWTTTGHTETQVEAYAWGALSEQVVGIVDNTQIHGVMRSEVPAWHSRSLQAGTLVWGHSLGAPGGTPLAGDYDGDGQAELAVYQNANGRWFIQNRAGTLLLWGTPWGYQDTLPVSGDYDGDGRDDLAIYDPVKGHWYIRSVNGAVLAWQINWGYPHTRPVMGDYDGDGIHDLAILDERQGHWFIRGLNGTVLAWRIQWGFAGGIPVPGDYDGDGRDDLAIYDPVSNRWYIRQVDKDILAWGLSWGYAGVVPVPGDYDGNGRADLMVYDPRRGLWYGRSRGGQVLAWAQPWGYSPALPVPGDLDGDGRSDLTVAEMP